MGMVFPTLPDSAPPVSIGYPPDVLPLASTETDLVSGLHVPSIAHLPPTPADVPAPSVQQADLDVNDDRLLLPGFPTDSLDDGRLLAPSEPGRASQPGSAAPVVAAAGTTVPPVEAGFAGGRHWACRATAETEGATAPARPSFSSIRERDVASGEAQPAPLSGVEPQLMNGQASSSGTAENAAAPERQTQTVHSPDQAGAARSRQTGPRPHRNIAPIDRERSDEPSDRQLWASPDDEVATGSDPTRTGAPLVESRATLDAGTSEPAVKEWAQPLTPAKGPSFASATNVAGATPLLIRPPWKFSRSSGRDAGGQDTRRPSGPGNERPSQQNDVHNTMAAASNPPVFPVVVPTNTVSAPEPSTVAEVESAEGTSPEATVRNAAPATGHPRPVADRNFATPWPPDGRQAAHGVPGRDSTGQAPAPVAIAGRLVPLDIPVDPIAVSSTVIEESLPVTKPAASSYRPPAREAIPPMTGGCGPPAAPLAGEPTADESPDGKTAEHEGQQPAKASGSSRPHERSAEAATDQAAAAGPQLDPATGDQVSFTPAPARAASDQAFDRRQPHAAEPTPSLYHADGAQPEAAKPPLSARNITLEMANGDQRVEVRMVDRGGSVHLAVRTPDPHLSGALRENLTDLSARLEQTGFRAESWRTSDGLRRDLETMPGVADRNPQSDPDGRRQGDPEPRQPEDSKGQPNRKEKGNAFEWFMASLRE